LRLATAKVSDKDSKAEVDKIFQSFDINKAVIYFVIKGKNYHFGIEKSRSRIGRGP